jgi:hypothetical protein
MTRFTRLTMLSAMAAGLVACGGGAKLGGGKDGAAQAAFQASQPAGRGGKTSQQLLDKALASGATSISVSANCANGGSASLTLDATNIGQNGELNYSVTYDACNEDGKNEYNGTMAMSLKFTTNIGNGTISASLITGMKGKLTIEGEVSDFIDANVKLTMAVSATETHTGSVSLVLDGTIKTSEGSYAYAGETLNITAGVLPEA